MHVTLTEFSAGHIFEPISLELDAERSLAYRDATGDALDVYDSQSALPPLAIAAFALGALLESVGLPPGTLHANELMRAHAAIPAGSTVECRARIAQRSQRGDWVVTVIESEIALGATTAITTRATVLCPAQAS